MKEKKIKTALLIAVLLFIVPPNMARADSWQTLDKGLEYQTIPLNTPQTGINTRLHVLKINLNKLVIKPVYSSTNLSAKNLAIKSGALAVINANFFDETGKVLGLVKKDGAVINPKKNISWWSVLCFRNNKAEIIQSSHVKEGYCHQAFQAGPRLVAGGTLTKLKDEFSQKTAAGINNRGDLLLAVSEGAIPIKKLAEIFSKKEKNGGLECPYALNLDGGSSSQMFIKSEKLNLYIPNYVKIPVGLGVFKK
ncbi:MAG: phosphodiester glycosidase family protein [Deltaproteobacteria bacterium]|nr:phosphodiester glycosidase family protein [Deltaproteobacteria bacterium]